MKRMTIFVAVITLCLLWAPAQAHTPKNALGAVAMSPDGKILVAGGDTRALYVLDPKNFEVIKRIWIQTNIYEMAFNRDGSTLVVEDTKETLYFFDTATWKIKNQVKKAGNFSAAPKVDLLAGMNPGYKKSRILLLSMSDGKQQGIIEHPGKALVIGLSPDGKKLVVLSDGPRDIEPKKKAPKKLRGLERAAFLQQHDGRTGVFTQYDVASGKQTRQQTVFYNPGGFVGMALAGDACYVLSYSNLNGKWQGDSFEMFHSQNSYNYGAGVSSDHKRFATGGLRDLTYVELDGLKMLKQKISSLPGWPEYFKGFGFGPDGSLYGVTTAYRLVVISPQGKLVKVVPIY